MQNKSAVVENYMSRGGSSQKTPIESEKNINKS